MLEVEDEGTLLAHEVFRLVPLQETSDCCSFLCAEINSHFDEISGARNVNGFDDFAYAKVEFFEFVKRNVRVERAQSFTCACFVRFVFKVSAKAARATDAALPRKS